MELQVKCNSALIDMPTESNRFQKARTLGAKYCYWHCSLQIVPTILSALLPLGNAR